MQIIQYKSLIASQVSHACKWSLYRLLRSEILQMCQNPLKCLIYLANELDSDSDRLVSSWWMMALQQCWHNIGTTLDSNLNYFLKQTLLLMQHRLNIYSCILQQFSLHILKQQMPCWKWSSYVIFVHWGMQYFLHDYSICSPHLQIQQSLLDSNFR